MKEPYVVFLGDVALDEYYEVERWPGRAEKVGTRVLPPQMGGMIANAASVYASYGAGTRFSGILNPRDKKLCDQLEANGIDTGLVVYDSSLADSKCMIFLAQGEHTVFIIDTQVESMPITPAIQQAYCDASMLYSGYWALRHLQLGAQTPTDIVRAWHASGVKLMIDADVDKLTEDDKAFLPYTHTLFMNEVGFENQRDGRSPAQTVSHLLSYGLTHLIVTLAEKGCVVYTKQGEVRVPGVPAQVVDVTGAGDTFCSSFAFFYELSGDTERAARFATYASSRAVTQMGARGGAVGVHAVLAYMAEKGADPAPYAALLGVTAHA